MTASPSIRFDAIVLAGGRGTRLGGAAKPLATIGGETLLGRALLAVSRARRVVVVGPDVLEPEADARGASLIREEPPFGGPVAAMAAGLDELSGGGGRWPVDWIVVIAADLVSPADAVSAVVAAAADDGADDGAVAVDPDGRVQHLLAVYRADALAAALGSLGRVDGASVRALTQALVLRAVPVTAAAARDVDTVDDLSAVGARAPAARADDGASESATDELDEGFDIDPDDDLSDLDPDDDLSAQ